MPIYNALDEQFVGVAKMLATVENDLTYDVLSMLIERDVLRAERARSQSNPPPEPLPEPEPEPEHKTIGCSDGSRLPAVLMLQMLHMIAMQPNMIMVTENYGAIRRQELTVLERTVIAEIDLTNADAKISLSGPDWHLHAITVGDGYKVRNGGNSLLMANLVIVNAKCRNAENFYRDLALFKLA